MKIFVTGAAGFIGGSVAQALLAAGHEVVGLARQPSQISALELMGARGVLGSIDDEALVETLARESDGVVNAASSDHRGAVQAIVRGLAGSGKPFVHTSGSSIIGDASGGEASDVAYSEDQLPAPTADKAARVAIDDLVIASSKKGIRSSVLCNTLIYGHGPISPDSVQLPRIVRQARKTGVVRHVGPGLNIWSNVHIDDVASAYVLAIEKASAGSFYFIESGEASFADMAKAISEALGLAAPMPWPLEDAIAEWGYEMASYGLGSNSRARGSRARSELGWNPQGKGVIDWIKQDMASKAGHPQRNAPFSESLAGRAG